MVQNGRIGMVSDRFAWDVKVQGLPSSWLKGGGVGADGEMQVGAPARLPYDDHFDLFPGKVHWVTTVDAFEQAGGKVRELGGTAINQLVCAVQRSLKMLISRRN
ncbi:MAG: hypothetical protein IMX00_07655 [Limnochordales bacterium]|nr:hypothetical protein [Limnochordales bacterium]